MSDDMPRDEWLRIHSAGFWAHLMAEVELGRHPSNGRLADGISVYGVPPKGPEALYVASRIVGQFAERIPPDGSDLPEPEPEEGDDEPWRR